MIITFFIFILKLLQRDESFDIKSDNSLSKLVGGLEVTGDVTYKDKSLETQITNLQSQINALTTSLNNVKSTADTANNTANSIINGGATIKGNLTLNGELSAKKITTRDGEIAIGQGDNGWNIRAQGVAGEPHRWLEFWNNQEGKTAWNGHGKVLFRKNGDIWSAQRSWITDLNGLCVNGTCVNGDHLKIIKGETPVALYHTHGGNAEGGFPWVHIQNDRHAVKWSSAQSYFKLIT